MIKCNNCGKEMESFKRTSRGLIKDSWYLEDGIYKYHEHEDEKVQETVWIECDNCHSIVDESTMFDIINKIEKTY